MALWVCLDCGTLYAVGLESCPHCGYKGHRGDWEESPPEEPPPAAKGKGKGAAASA